MKAYKGGSCVVPLIFILGTKWRSASSSRFIVGKAARYAFVPSIYELEKESKVH